MCSTHCKPNFQSGIGCIFLDIQRRLFIAPTALYVSMLQAPFLFVRPEMESRQSLSMDYNWALGDDYVNNDGNGEDHNISNSSLGRRKT